jgi:hypothetical protein
VTPADHTPADRTLDTVDSRHTDDLALALQLAAAAVDDAALRRIRSAMGQGVPPVLPGAVRASVGLATVADDLDRLVDALTALTTDGPRWTYRSCPDARTAGPTPTRAPGPGYHRPGLIGYSTEPSRASVSATTICARFRTPSLR